MLRPARSGRPFFCPLPLACNRQEVFEVRADTGSANGDRAGTLLFGAFFAWAAVDLISAVARGAVVSYDPEAKFDVMAIAGGAVVAVGVAALHRVLFGVQVVPFGL